MPPQTAGWSAGGRRMRAALAVAVLSLAAVVGPAGAASADDIYEIDERLVDAGFAWALTSALPAADSDGVRILVEFESASANEAALAEEAREISGLVWEHLEGEVLAIDVTSTAEVPWVPEGLPPTVSTARWQLVQDFGERPAGLDDSDVETVDETGASGGYGYEDGPSSGGVLVVVWLGSVVLAVALAVGLTVLAMRSRRPAVAAWGAGAYGPQAWPGAQQWPTGPQWPAEQQWPVGQSAPPTGPPPTSTDQRWAPGG
jgi:hypothetical protein